MRLWGLTCPCLFTSAARWMAHTAIPGSHSMMDPLFSGYMWLSLLCYSTAKVDPQFIPLTVSMEPEQNWLQFITSHYGNVCCNTVSFLCFQSDAACTVLTHIHTHTEDGMCYLLLDSANVSVTLILLMYDATNCQHLPRWSMITCHIRSTCIPTWPCCTTSDQPVFQHDHVELQRVNALHIPVFGIPDLGQSDPLLLHIPLSLGDQRERGGRKRWIQQRAAAA